MVICRLINKNLKKTSVTLNALSHRELGVTVKLFFLQNLYKTELVLPRFTSASNRGKINQGKRFLIEF